MLKCKAAVKYIYLHVPHCRVDGILLVMSNFVCVQACCVTSTHNGRNMTLYVYVYCYYCTWQALLLSCTVEVQLSWKACGRSAFMELNTV